MLEEVLEVLDGRRRWCVVHGDCAAILPAMATGSVAHVLSDPPYGVDLAYGEHDDAGGAPYEGRMLAWHAEALRVAAGYVAFTPGVLNQWIYPRPRWVMSWAKKGSTRRSYLGGFNEWEPLLVYGTVERHRVFNDCIVLPDCVNHTKDETGHPCPKPVALYRWLVESLSVPDDVVLDPFTGSGTTGIAALGLGRRFIGIEKDPRYAAVAHERLQAESQGLTLRDARAGQRSLFGGDP